MLSSTEDECVLQDGFQIDKKIKKKVCGNFFERHYQTSRTANSAMGLVEKLNFKTFNGSERKIFLLLLSVETVSKLWYKKMF